MVAGAVLLGEAEQFGQIFSERLDSVALGKLTTVCRAFRGWARSNGRALKLVLQHPTVTLNKTPLPSVWRPLPDGESSGPVPWALNKYDLRIAPAFTSTHTPVCDKPPVVESIYLLDGDKSGVDRRRSSFELHLLHATTKAVVQTVVETGWFSEESNSLGTIKFRLKRLSSHYCPRAMLQLRLTINVALHGQTQTKSYVAHSDPLHIVSKIPTARSMEISKARSRR